jgi:hypothetical protein
MASAAGLPPLGNGNSLTFTADFEQDNSSEALFCAEILRIRACYPLPDITTTHIKGGALRFIGYFVVPNW